MTVMLQSGLDIRPVITHRFPFSEYEAGFEAIEMHPKINDSKREEPGIPEPLQPSLL
jgi:threonine dehydrogenase-like Zn-dependent dehydrogenase